MALVGILGVVALLGLGAAGAASAGEVQIQNTVVPCDSGPPEPISLEYISEGTAVCFGGTVGFENVGANIGAFGAGGYYGHLFLRSADGSEVFVLPFYPNEGTFIGAYVTVVEITPPFDRAELPDTLDGHKVISPSEVAAAVSGGRDKI